MSVTPTGYRLLTYRASAPAAPRSAGAPAVAVAAPAASPAAAPAANAQAQLAEIRREGESLIQQEGKLMKVLDRFSKWVGNVSQEVASLAPTKQAARPAPRPSGPPEAKPAGRPGDSPAPSNEGAPGAAPADVKRWWSDAQEAGAKYGVDPRLILAIITVESSGNPQAVSSCGARGLMQLMPSTASGLGVHDAFDPKQNIDGGTKYIGELVKQYGLESGIRAYNGGPGNRNAACTADYGRKVLNYFHQYGG